MKKFLWELNFHFGDGDWKQRRVSGECLLMGAHHDAKLRFPALDADSLLKVSFDEKVACPVVESNHGKLKLFEQKEKTLHFNFGEAEFKIHLVEDERVLERFEPETWVASFEKFEEASYSLWHMRDGILIESVLLGADRESVLLKCGYQVIWKPKEDPTRFLIHEHNSDVHSLELESGRKGALRAVYGDDVFVITKVPDKNLLSKLDQPLEKAPVDHSRRRAVGFFASWLLLMSLLQLMPSGTPKEIVETLSPEAQKIVLEAPRQKAGGDGQVGGGGIDTEQYDRKGGSGLAALDKLVKDKNTPFGGKGVLSALSALDEGMKSGKFNTAAIVPSNAGARIMGTAQGVLGALGKIQGSGGGGGVGIGGVGTKGFGGGGGGGTGRGYGTGVGNGLGKGDGFRNVIFESDNSVIQGGLDRSEVDAVVQENLSQIRFCYNRGLRGNPNLQGKVISAFTIGAEGKVTRSRLKDSTLSAPEVESCIQERVALWKFPKPRGGGEVMVSYPFLLKSN